MIRWPLMWKSTADEIRLENYTLRDALRNANEELRKHRTLIAGLRTGQTEVVNDLERILKGARQ